MANKGDERDVTKCHIPIIRQKLDICLYFCSFTSPYFLQVLSQKRGASSFGKKGILEWKWSYPIHLSALTILKAFHFVYSLSWILPLSVTFSRTRGLPLVSSAWLPHFQFLPRVKPASHESVSLHQFAVSPSCPVHWKSIEEEKGIGKRKLKRSCR